MREILFRGKQCENNKWIIGYLSSKHTITITTPCGHTDEIVICADTVGQYTGLKDKNGKRIFEWDIMKQKDITYQDEIQIEGEKYLVTSSSGCWFGICKKPDCKRAIFLSELCNTGEVIGNLHDNPELLEK